jgi:predicted nucleic acid-binding protein
VSNKWVVNASPLILLAKIGQIDLLSRLTENFVVPASVVRELSDGPADDPARQWLVGVGSQRKVADLAPDQLIVTWDLGAGETAVLTWALQRPGFEGIIDDRAARRCAAVHGIPFRGTLGVILAARQRNLITAAKPICDDLVRAGLLIDQALIRRALDLVGE